MNERVQKLLASAGLGSRREIEKWISDKRVTVNGSVAKLGDRAKPDDEILVDGRFIALQQEQLNRVLIYNKSEGEVSTTYDPKDRPIIFDRLPRLIKGRWITVGRLDINTTGLLLITNYGDLAHRLMHPSFSIEREYLVRVYGRMDAAAVRRLTNGVELEDGIAKFSSIVPHNFDLEKSSLSLSNSWFRVILLEGRNREVRRLFESQGVKVSTLWLRATMCILLQPHMRIGRPGTTDPSGLASVSDPTQTTGSTRSLPARPPPPPDGPARSTRG